MNNVLRCIGVLVVIVVSELHGQSCNAPDPGPRIPKTAAEVLRRYSAMQRKMLAVSSVLTVPTLNPRRFSTGAS
jgi:hypothetical protein